MSKWAFAITASRKGFGMPFRLVLPSAASENIVSISDSNWSAGRISHRKTSSSSPAFHQVCDTPGAMPRRLAGADLDLRPATFAPSVPETTSNVSHWLRVDVSGGDAAARGRRGARSGRGRRRSSAAVSTNVMRSPVTGLTSVCPFSITSASLLVVDALTIARRRGCGNRGGLSLAVRLPTLRWCGATLCRVDEIHVIRPRAQGAQRQGLEYFLGVSDETCGSTGLAMHLVVVPPGAERVVPYRTS